MKILSLLLLVVSCSLSGVDGESNGGGNNGGGNNIPTDGSPGETLPPPPSIPTDNLQEALKGKVLISLKVSSQAGITAAVVKSSLSSGLVSDDGKTIGEGDALLNVTYYPSGTTADFVLQSDPSSIAQVTLSDNGRRVEFEEGSSLPPSSVNGTSHIVDKNQGVWNDGIRSIQLTSRGPNKYIYKGDKKLGEFIVKDDDFSKPIVLGAITIILLTKEGQSEFGFSSPATTYLPQGAVSETTALFQITNPDDGTLESILIKKIALDKVNINGKVYSLAS